jgi:7-keto-8-aminopelargonate synthetase-like enzyme
MSGLSKIAGAKQQVESFKHLGLPQGFRIFTGFVQIAGVALLVIGYWGTGIAALGGLWLGVTMLGAVLAHFRAKDSFGKALPAFVLALLSLAITFINFEDLQNLFS